MLLDALSSGKKFHFDNVAGFTERFVLQPTIAPLLECLGNINLNICIVINSFDYQ
jgi:hypothetical protein